MSAGWPSPTNEPGAGRLTRREGFGMDDYADCFAAFLRALRIEPAHLVGLSFGGALVLATFHRHRSLASSLALVSGYAGWAGSLGSAEAQQRLTRSLEVSQLPPDEFAAVMLPSMFSPSVKGEVVATFADTPTMTCELPSQWRGHPGRGAGIEARCAPRAGSCQ